MPVDKTTAQQQLDEDRELFRARQTELENTARFLDLFRKHYEQEIVEIEAEIELLKRHIKYLNQKALADLTQGYTIDPEKKWKFISRKYKDARKFYNLIISKTGSGEVTIIPETLEQITQLHQTLVENYNLLNSILNKQYGSYKQLLEQFQKTTDQNEKEKLKDKLEEEERALVSAEIKFDYSYNQLIIFEPLAKQYKEFAKKEIEEKLKKDNVDLKDVKGAKLANSKERLDRVKFLIYIDKYKQYYLEGKPVPVPFFYRFESLYNKDGTIDPDKFPEFFEKLTGLDFEQFDLENDIQAEELRQMLAQHEIDQLEGHELRQLKIDLVEDDLYSQEEKDPLIEYISDKETKEKETANTPKKKLDRYKKTAADELKRATDPYLSKNPSVQKRAEMTHKIIYEDFLGRGDIKSLIRLTELPDLESMRPDIGGFLKEYAKERFIQAKDAAVNKIVEKIDEHEIGAKVRAGGKKVITSVVDKSRFIQKHRRRAKKQGLSLLMYVIKKILEKTVGKVVDVAKTGLRAVRNSKSVVSIVNSIKGTSFAQGLQRFSTSTLQSVRDLITKGRLVYRNVLKNPIVVGAMDTGYVAKTALKKVPKGLVYGAGFSSIALHLGVSSGALLPIFVGGSLLGVGLETVAEIMNSPTKRMLGRPLRWLQSHGQAIYKDPVSKAFSGDLVKNSPRALAGKSVNLFGTRAGRIFGAAKTGLSAAMLAATIAGLLGINPLLAAGIAFGTVASAKFIAQTVAGPRIANRFISGELSSLGKLPMNRIMGHIFNANIVGNLIQELHEWLRSGRGLNDFFKENFTFGKDKNHFEKFNNLNNYFASIGFFGSYSYLVRYLFGGMLFSRLTSMGLLTTIGESQFARFFPALGGTSFFSQIGKVGLLRALALSIRGALAPTLIFAVSSIAGLGLASLLGIPIGGIGATIGATVGGLVGTGAGLILGAALSGGALSIPLAAALNLVGTTIGAWIGSFFDKAIDGALKGMFAIVGGISFLFSLIDILNNKSLNPRKLAMASISLALTLPALTAIIDKGSSSQTQADPTIPTPTVAMAYNNIREESATLEVVNKTDYTLDQSEVNKLTSLIRSELLISAKRNTYLIFSDSEQSNVFLNNDTVLLTVSVRENNPEQKVAALISDLNLSD